jgi:uncharacterized protein (DUF58 family)
MMLLRICAALCFAGAVFAKADGVDVVFLLDVSQTMFGPDRFIASGARLATYQLESNDRVAVLSFSSGVKLDSGFTAETGKIDAAFWKATRTLVRSNRARPLYDALITAIEQFPKGDSLHSKRVVAVITNDVDHASVHHSDEVIREAKERAVAIWAFLIANPYSDPAHVRNGYPRIPYPDVQFAADQLRPITAETGGKASIHDMNGYVLRQAIAACKGNGE